MDDTVARPKYTRRTVPARRRKKSFRETGTLFDSLMRQVLLSIVILVLVGIIKSVNTPATKFMSEKVKYVVSEDIDVKQAYTKVNEYLDNIFKNSDEKSGEANSTLDTELTAENNTDSGTDESDEAVGDVRENENTDTGSNDISRSEDEDTTRLVASMKEKYSFVTPIKGVVTSPFGQRIHPAWKTEGFHSGVDIGAKKGDPIKAAMGGTVIEAGNTATYGKYIKIEHEDDIITLYGHCFQLLVKKGEKVKAGSTIAKAGNTGVSVGVHLHFEIWKDGRPLDPLEFIKVSE